MAESLHPVRFPNESGEYRAKRDELLKGEIELRKRIEELAAQRRALPLGGRVREDYVFEERRGEARRTRLSELFEDGKDSLIVYNFMYGPEMPEPCPMCTSILDGLDGQAHHVSQRVNLAVVAKSPIDRILEFAGSRPWNRLRLLSSARNTFNADYQGENGKNQQMPACNVFVRRPDGVYHAYATELLFADVGGQARHMDHAWPLWNLFDMTPDGRGTDWYPRLKY